jgi:hypothetical protein
VVILYRIVADRKSKSVGRLDLIKTPLAMGASAVIPLRLTPTPSRLSFRYPFYILLLFLDFDMVASLPPTISSHFNMEIP